MLKLLKPISLLVVALVATVGCGVASWASSEEPELGRETVDAMQVKAESLGSLEAEETMRCMKSRGFDVLPSDLDGQPRQYLDGDPTFWRMLEGERSNGLESIAPGQSLEELETNVGCRVWGRYVFNEAVMAGELADPDFYEGDFEDLMASDPVLGELEDRLVLCVKGQGFDVASYGQASELRSLAARQESSSSMAAEEEPEQADTESVGGSTEPSAEFPPGSSEPGYLSAFAECEDSLKAEFDQRIAELLSSGSLP